MIHVLEVQRLATGPAGHLTRGTLFGIHIEHDRPPCKLWPVAGCPALAAGASSCCLVAGRAPSGREVCYLNRTILSCQTLMLWTLVCWFDERQSASTSGARGMVMPRGCCLGVATSRQVVCRGPLRVTLGAVCSGTFHRDARGSSSWSELLLCAVHASGAGLCPSREEARARSELLSS
jgi:hypothetical protein